MPDELFDEYIAKYFGGSVMAIEQRGFLGLSVLARRLHAAALAGKAPEMGINPKVPVAKGRVAVLPITGFIDHRTSGFDFFGGGYSTSMQETGQLLRACMDSPDISTIVLDLASWGGSVHGVDEFAAQVREARQHKQIISVCNAMACSACYYAGSAAGKMYTTPSGELGSIGVLQITTNIKSALEKEGVDVRILRKPPGKANMNMYETPTDEVVAYEQAKIDTYYDAFEEAVAANRGVRRSKVAAEFGGGRTLLAAKACEVGMCDGIKTLDQVLSELTKTQPNGRGDGRKASLQTMNALRLAALRN